jgi:uncharacterized protein
MGPYAYSYTFDGQVGYLDYALASASLVSQVRGATEWHINADEPDILDYDTSFKPPAQDALYEPNAYRSSDHDPVIVGLYLSQAPVLGPISVAPNPLNVGVSAAASADFTDRGDPYPHTGLWDWGDGTTSAALFTEANGAGTATGTHAYAAAGLYTVSLTVTDADGESDQVFYQYVVVYDLKAGYFTGGGWITSPAGAYAPDPLLSGKLEFVFDVKYLKNGSGPVGALTAILADGAVTFQATSYDWLVVTPGPKAQFQGSGMLNGMDGYKLQAFAFDGRPDTFRLLIWTEDETGMHVVYDSGAPQALGGGKITHHTK